MAAVVPEVADGVLHYSDLCLNKHTSTAEL